MNYICDLKEFIPWTELWSFISAIATCIIGYFAYKIAKAQLEIERHKKDDFLYEHRFNAYITFISNFQTFLVKIDTEKDRYSLVDNLNKSKYAIEMLYNDEEIQKHINLIINNALLINNNIQNVCAIYDPYIPATEQHAKEIEAENTAIKNALDNYIDDKTLHNLFSKYLNLDANRI